MKPTLIFDFDSTLIKYESLELILSEQLKTSPEKMKQIEHLTHLGMEGKLSFQESLQKRLEIASPNLKDLTEFGKNSLLYITDGMKELLNWAKNNFELWIVSGGLKESIQPFADAFEISHVHAVSLNWTSTGKFISLNDTDPFSKSKVDGVKTIFSSWKKPSVMVGDGFTDFKVFSEGYSTDFIGFTQNVRRSFLNENECLEASNCIELKVHLKKILNT